jgi:hypothetical protein
MKPELLSCGHMSTPDDLTPGYARTVDDRKICYACADEETRALMRRTDRTFLYLSGDCRSVTTWTGGKVGDVVSHRTARVGFGHTERHYVRVVDLDGKRWYGTSPGGNMYCLLRASKGQAQ